MADVCARGMPARGLPICSKDRLVTASSDRWNFRQDAKTYRSFTARGLCWLTVIVSVSVTEDAEVRFFYSGLLQ